MWYMKIDESFFPTAEKLATFVDASPHFERKNLIVRGNINDQGTESRDYDQSLKLGEDRVTTSQLEPLHIEKIYHAQCLEKYPDHFAAFVKLSCAFESSSEGKKVCLLAF